MNMKKHLGVVFTVESLKMKEAIYSAGFTYTGDKLFTVEGMVVDLLDTLKEIHGVSTFQTLQSCLKHYYNTNPEQVNNYFSALKDHNWKVHAGNGTYVFVDKIVIDSRGLGLDCSTGDIHFKTSIN